MTARNAKRYDRVQERHGEELAAAIGLLFRTGIITEPERDSAVARLRLWAAKYGVTVVERGR
jgi:hypothetical protein